MTVGLGSAFVLFLAEKEMLGIVREGILKTAAVIATIGRVACASRGYIGLAPPGEALDEDEGSASFLLTITKSGTRAPGLRRVIAIRVETRSGVGTESDLCEESCVMRWARSTVPWEDLRG